MLGGGVSLSRNGAAVPLPAVPVSASDIPGGETVQTVPLARVRSGPLQPRKDFAPGALEELAASIKEKGIVQPLLVRPVADAAADFELVAGERRWRAAQRVGLHEVPVLVRPFADAEVIEIAV